MAHLSIRMTERPAIPRHRLLRLLNGEGQRVPQRLAKNLGRPAALWIRDLELDVHKLGADSLGLSELAGHAHLTRPAPISGAVLDEVAQLALGKRPGKNDAAPGHTQKRGIQSRPIHAATHDLNRLASQRLPSCDEVGPGY